MCCLFITSSSPLRPTSPSLNVFESRFPSPRVLRPASHVPRPGVGASHVPTSPSPTSPRPRVPRPGVPASRRPDVPASHVPASPSTTSQSPRVLTSQVPRPRPTFSHSPSRWTRPRHRLSAFERHFNAYQHGIYKLDFCSCTSFDLRDLVKRRLMCIFF